MTATPDRRLRGDDQSPEGEFAGLLIESEARYHEAGAQVIPFEGGSLALVRGPDGDPLQAVVQRIRPAAIRAPLDHWLGAIEHRFRGFGVRCARVLMGTPVFHVEVALRERGWTEHAMIGLVAPTDRPADPAREAREDLSPFVGHRFVLNAAAGDEDWARAAALRNAEGNGAQLERRKAESGYSHPYLIRHEGRLCATFTVAPTGPLLRIRGLAVSALPGEEGLAHAVVDAALDLAAQGGWNHAGCLLPADNEAAADPWRRAGFRPVVRVSEWRRRLAAAKVARAS